MIKNTLITFYGGTFDPIHYGHLLPVMSLANILNIHNVNILLNNMPAYRSPPIASKKQRFQMANLAISELSKTLFTLDNRDLLSSTSSWTVDIFESLREIYGPNVPLGFIMGQDSLLTLPHWHRGLVLLELCHLLVCARPGYGDHLDKKSNHLKLLKHITEDSTKLYQQPAGLIYYAMTPKFIASSTYIRACYKRGHICNRLLPISVQDYIDENKLYR